MAAFSFWQRFLFPNPTSFTAAWIVITILASVHGCYCEFSGIGAQYSKFAPRIDKKKKKKDDEKENEAEDLFHFQSKTGMLILYGPSATIANWFLAYRCACFPQLFTFILPTLGVAGFKASSQLIQLQQQYCTPDVDYRLVAVAAALSVHYSKRVLEVLFLHSYSGIIRGKDMIFISICYATSVVHLLHTQVLSTSLPSPMIDLKGLGLAVFLLGISGNFYHHYLLSQLRKDGDKKYVVPHRGLFEVLVCPHYIFETIIYLGIAMISQTAVAFASVFSVGAYLTGRSAHTKQWYTKKLDNFPKERKILIPMVY